MKLGLGRIVIVNTQEPFNGSRQHPAVINRVWGTGDTTEGPQGANVTVLPDCGTPFCMTSVMVHDKPLESIGQAFVPPRV